MGLAAWLAACSGATPQPGVPPEASLRRAIVVTQVALHAARPNTVLALTNFSVGLLKSVDAGEHWDGQSRHTELLLYGWCSIRNPTWCTGAGSGSKSVDGARSFAENTDSTIPILGRRAAPEHPIMCMSDLDRGIHQPGRANTDGVESRRRLTQSQQFQDLVIARRS
jgi:hypothetical protein